ncbi:hypothetical protein E2493_09755 [Sphingomonas parva]|uniref:Uncharacterized protein n=1 Tax=Sphingomonas parva TaxID=2555898 RepID=A0A4Y8ZQX7_9SPHN|nr:hypothetical protein [Sphingomonas parva]TFI58411.1 hypothetical protein E2493_09755 [Sphingomonas parva]
MADTKLEMSIVDDEPSQGSSPGGAAAPRWHVVVQQPGQTRAEAFATYGRDRIGDNDAVILGFADPAAGRAEDAPPCRLRFHLPPIETAQDSERGGAALLAALGESRISVDDALTIMALLVGQSELIQAGENERRIESLGAQLRRGR